jgi:hypothetical protein
MFQTGQLLTAEGQKVQTLKIPLKTVPNSLDATSSLESVRT